LLNIGKLGHLSDTGKGMYTRIHTHSMSRRISYRKEKGKKNCIDLSEVGAQWA